MPIALGGVLGEGEVHSRCVDEFANLAFESVDSRHFFGRRYVPPSGLRWEAGPLFDASDWRPPLSRRSVRATNRVNHVVRAIAQGSVADRCDGRLAIVADAAPDDHRPELGEKLRFVSRSSSCGSCEIPLSWGPEGECNPDTSIDGSMSRPGQAIVCLSPWRRSIEYGIENHGKAVTVEASKAPNLILNAS